MNLPKLDLPANAFIHPNGQNQAAVAQLFEQVMDLLLCEMGQAGRRSPLPPLTHLPDHYIPNQGIPETELLTQLKAIIQQSMNAAHPGYIGHMDSIPSSASILGDLVAGALNNNMLSVEMSPVLSRLEPLLLKEIAGIFGLPETAGGVLVSGGSLGNLQAIALARNSHFPILEQGLAGLEKPPVFFVSAAAHTSFKKAAMVLGLGSTAAVAVATDRRGKLDCEALEAAIAQAHRNGQAPFAVVATAGTTITGNIDPLEPIAAICRRHRLWFHVDASYGGALAFSPDHQPLLRGIDQAESITFNPQKWLYVTKTCAMTLFRDAKAWQDSFRIGAPYMGEADDAINLGEVSLQGTRHGDVLKLWMTLQHLGRQGCSSIIERNLALTQVFLQKIRDRPYLKLATEPEMNIICFRAEPGQGAATDRDGVNWDDWNGQLQNHLLETAKVFVSLPLYQGQRWLKVVLLNPFTTLEQLEQLFQALDQFVARPGPSRQRLKA